MLPSRHFAFIPCGLVTALTGCGEPAIEGGPCRYEALPATATVISVDANNIEARIDPVGIEAQLDRAWFGDPPAIGDQLEVVLEQQIDGTCTPVIITLPDNQLTPGQ